MKGVTAGPSCSITAACDDGKRDVREGWSYGWAGSVMRVIAWKRKGDFSQSIGLNLMIWPSIDDGSLGVIDAISRHSMAASHWWTFP